MPIVRYVLSRLVLDNEAKILKSSGLKDMGEWDYSKIREHLAGDGKQRPGFIRVYRDWEDLGEITDPRTGKRLAFDFQPAGKVPLGSPKTKGARAISLNQKTVDWLARSIEFNDSAFKALNAVKGLPKIEGPRMASVSQLVSSILNEEAKAVVIQSDVAEIGRE